MTTPFWPYGGKGWLNPVTRDVFVDADMINNRPIKPRKLFMITKMIVMNTAITINLYPSV